MQVKIQQMATLETYDITDVSKAMLVRKFKKKVKEITGVDVKQQNLYFGGKLLNDDCDLCDYKIENGYKIQMQVRQPLEPITNTSNPNESSSISTETSTKEETTDKKLSEEEKLLIGKYIFLIIILIPVNEIPRYILSVAVARFLLRLGSTTR